MRITKPLIITLLASLLAATSAAATKKQTQDDADTKKSDPTLEIMLDAGQPFPKKWDEPWKSKPIADPKSEPALKIYAPVYSGRVASIAPSIGGEAEKAVSKTQSSQAVAPKLGALSIEKPEFDLPAVPEASYEVTFGAEGAGFELMGFEGDEGVVVGFEMGEAPAPVAGTSPVPEPSAALLFTVGALLASAQIRRAPAPARP